MTTVYFIRHAQPNYENHDDMLRELSSKGLEDRKLVTRFLADKQIDVILSSPYKRAVDTVRDFADARNLSVRIMDNFRERRVDSGWIEDFDAFCRRQWADFDFRLSDGECLREVQTRNICALNAVLREYRGRNIAIGSHGTALSTVIQYFDPAFGYHDFQKIRFLMPWIVRFTFEETTCTGIRKYDLFENEKQDASAF